VSLPIDYRVCSLQRLCDVSMRRRAAREKDEEEIVTLGQVLAEDGFEDVRAELEKLLGDALKRPVQDLDEGLREAILSACRVDLQLQMRLFFSACARKHARVDAGEMVGATLERLMEEHAARRQASVDHEKMQSSEVPDVKGEHLRATLGPYLKLVNREQSINTLQVHAAQQYGMYLAGFTAKQQRFAVCSGAPGLGKTMFCHKAFLRAVDKAGMADERIWANVQQRFDEEESGATFKSVVGECVAKGRVLHISFDDVVGPEELLDVAKSLALRLLECFLTPTKVAWDAFANQRGSVLLPRVVRLITGGDKKAFVVVHFDETNIVMREKAGRQYLQTALGLLRSSNRNERAGFLYCILSGTNVVPLHELLVSENNFAPLDIALPLLAPEHVRDVVWDLVERGRSGGDLGEQLEFVVQVLDGCRATSRCCCMPWDAPQTRACFDRPPMRSAWRPSSSRARGCSKSSRPKSRKRTAAILQAC
jgi:hypothetical protein